MEIQEGKGLSFLKLSVMLCLLLDAVTSGFLVSIFSLVRWLNWHAIFSTTSLNNGCQPLITIDRLELDFFSPITALQQFCNYIVNYFAVIRYFCIPVIYCVKLPNFQ